MKKGGLFALAFLVVILTGAGIWMTSRPELDHIIPMSADAEPKEIVIGYNAAMSNNPVANFGISAMLGTRLAVDDINAEGGILGLPVRLVVMDDEGNPELSKQNMERLIFEEKVSAVIGPANSGNALHWLDLPQENEVIVISPIATATEITTRFQDRPRNYIFRISSLDKEQVRHIMAWTMSTTPSGNVALLHDTTPYGSQGRIDVADVLGRWGKTPVYVRPVEAGASQTELVRMLTEAQDAGAEAVMIYSLVDISSAVARAAASINGFRPILLGTAANTIDIWSIVGDAAENLYWSAVIMDDGAPATVALQERVVALHGAPATAITTTANAYDAILLLKNAFETAGSTDRKAVRDALENTGMVEGILKAYERPFSKTDHEAMSATDYTVGHWKDGVRVLFREETDNLEIR